MRGTYVLDFVLTTCHVPEVGKRVRKARYTILDGFVVRGR